MFVAALSRMAQKWKQPKWPLSDEWINKCDMLIPWNIV